MARPRKYETPPSAATYRHAARASLKARGGKVVAVQLEPEDLDALEAIRRPGETLSGVLIRALHKVQGQDWP